ncbi:MAG: FHA domain-containing protein [Anaerolineae bacterium]|nr:FHA domain-containing protein [Anaerolineae bacterium]
MDDLTRRMHITSKGHKVKWGTASLGSEPILMIHVGSLTAEPIQVNLSHELILGRAEANDPDVDINLAVYEAAQKGVSRRHASLEKVTKNVMLIDLNSTNGTFLNEQRIFPNQRRVVRDGDEIRLGRLVMYIFYEKQVSKFEDARYEAIKRYIEDADSRAEETSEDHSQTNVDSLS